MTPWPAVIALVYVMGMVACSALAFSRGMWWFAIMGGMGVVMVIRGTVRLYRHGADAPHSQEDPR